MQRLKRFFGLLRGFFPKALPIGANELNNFCSYIFGLYLIPDLPSYKLAISTMIMHLGPTTAYKSPFWFFRSIRAAQAKEVAYQLVEDDRQARNLAERQAKQAAAELKASQTAVTQSASTASENQPQATA